MYRKNTTWLMFLGLAILGAIIFSTAYVTGGDLNPDNSPSPTMRTLDELYKNIQPGLPSDWLPYPTEQQVIGKGAILMSVTGQVQGAFRGSAIDDMIKIVGLGHQVAVPTDSITGLPSGRRQHKPLIVSKYTDRSTPQLYRALTTNENLKHVYLRFFQKDSSDRMVQYYTIHLMNARINDIKTAYPNIEQVSFVYQTIEWIWEDGDIITSDDWEAPVI
ncbi:MAG TPA: type VI secretion system tube protein TssD [Anaerohalosphaeraceae bacterium]|nr:type VI secretion system tube protein TssD [Anaerohalosphaeraceae bacterium]